MQDALASGQESFREEGISTGKGFVKNHTE